MAEVRRVRISYGSNDHLRELRRANAPGASSDRMETLRGLVRSYGTSPAGSATKKGIGDQIEKLVSRHAREAALAGSSGEAAKRYVAGAKICMKLEGYTDGEALSRKRARRMVKQAANYAARYHGDGGDVETSAALAREISALREKYRADAAK